MTTPETKTVTTNPKRVIVLGRLAFVHLFDKAPKKKLQPGEVAKPEDLVYQTAILLPPTTNLDKLRAAISAACVDAFGKVVTEFTGSNGTGNALRKCNGQWAGYAPGWFVINAKSEAPVPVVDGGKLPVTERHRVYAGMWCNVALDCYAWQYGGYGYSFALKGVQLVRDGADTDPDGARLDGKGARFDAEESFEAIPMEGEGETGGAVAGDDPLAGLK